MTIDRYTRVVLTVIAVCLVWLSLGGPSLVTPVSAQKLSGYDRVLIAGWIDAAGVEHQLKANDSKGLATRLPVELSEPR
jgi:hypothetical protein